MYKTLYAQWAKALKKSNCDANIKYLEFFAQSRYSSFAFFCSLLIAGLHFTAAARTMQPRDQINQKGLLKRAKFPSFNMY